MTYLSFEVIYPVRLHSAYFIRQNCARPFPNVLNTKKPGFYTWLYVFQVELHTGKYLLRKTLTILTVRVVLLTIKDNTTFNNNKI